MQDEVSKAETWCGRPLARAANHRAWSGAFPHFQASECRAGRATFVRRDHSDRDAIVGVSASPGGRPILHHHNSPRRATGAPSSEGASGAAPGRVPRGRCVVGGRLSPYPVFLSSSLSSSRVLRVHLYARPGPPPSSSVCGWSVVGCPGAARGGGVQSRLLAACLRAPRQQQQRQPAATAQYRLGPSTLRWS